MRVCRAPHAPHAQARVAIAIAQQVRRGGGAESFQAASAMLAHWPGMVERHVESGTSSAKKGKRKRESKRARRRRRAAHICAEQQQFALASVSAGLLAAMEDGARGHALTGPKVRGSIAGMMRAD